MVRQRMTGKERREQLISIGRQVFAERGFEGASVEEIAARAAVSKPVVYEHFGGKEGLYAVVVDREMLRLEQIITQALSQGRSRVRIEQAVIALLTYVEEETDGFLILVRDLVPGQDQSYATLLNTAVGQVSHILGRSFENQGLDPEVAILYGQALVGMVSMTAQWWLDERQPAKEVVAAHIVNLCWNGLAGMKSHPTLSDEVTAQLEEKK
ncbi:MAG TPA: TetR/AcrR family transcriptional regulator [Corynebacterium pollutisoli]|nr:TetR/AcrR family transcriptional regulator [Corynebacterium pollutisoli]NLP40331.1 TetR/AcrR family transcriptional regulator [Corynebacterium pollutisoli]HJD79887.1 TetR/AcrR family transcriptional regulator [Corynebacterium pollutisoli]